MRGTKTQYRKSVTEFEPQGMKVFAISAQSGKRLKELLYYVKQLLDTIDKEPVIFEQEFFPEDGTDYRKSSIYSCSYEDADEHVFIEETERLKKCLVIQIWILKRDFYSSRSS